MDSKTRELATVSYLHYRRGFSQTEIAKQLGKSKMTVSRLLREARERGIVQFRLTVPCPSDPVIESKLKAEFSGLDDVIAVEEHLSGMGDVKRVLGQVAADYLPFFVKSGDHLGVGGGETLAHMVDALNGPIGVSDITVVQLTGVTGQVARLGNETLTTQKLSEKLGAQGFFCPIPSPFDQRLLKGGEQLLAQFCLEARDRWNRIDVGVIGIGATMSRISRYREGYLSPEQLERLLDEGAVGDVLLHFFGADGQIVDHAFDATVTAISWEQLEHVNTVIAIAGGEEKTESILAALRSGLIDVLIVDRSTASRVLERKRTEDPKPAS